MNDTSPDIQGKMLKMYAERTPADRLRMACRMFGTAKKLMRAGLLKENKNYTEAQLREKMFLRMYRYDFTNTEIQQIIKRLSPGREKTA